MTRKKSAREMWELAEAANKTRKRAYKAWERAVDKAASATRAEDIAARNAGRDFLSDAELMERHKLRAAADYASSGSSGVWGFAT
jgi:hypothetical protein